jgi:hypothetical protein
MTYPNPYRALKQLQRHHDARWKPGGPVMPVATPLGPLDLTALNETVARQQEGARQALAAMGRTVAPFLDGMLATIVDIDANIGL